MPPRQIPGSDRPDRPARRQDRHDAGSRPCFASVVAARRPAQQMLAAHVPEQPANVREKRPDVPPGLADLVMRCMASA